MRHALRSLALLLLVAHSAMAAIPSLVAEGDDGKVALELSALSIRATIRGHLARTEYELTFRNSLDRVTGGEFLFPLPVDAEVSDLGLWFDGHLRHGVAVERVLARMAYEETVHRAVDPALAEWSASRAFRFSVYPIPAKGEKKVFIAYDQELTTADYELDLRYGRVLDSADVIVDADGRAIESIHARGETLDRVIRVARDPRETALVARSPEDGYWYASATIDVRSAERRMPPAAHVVILYDTSSSSVQQNATLLRDFLGAFLSRQQSWATADLFPFHIDLDAPRRIERAGTSAGMRDLENALGEMPLLGATNLMAVVAKLPKLVAALPPSSRIVLVTDGLTSLGDSREVSAAVAGLSNLGRPVLVLNASSTADDRLLTNIATATGGWAIDLQLTTRDEAVQKAMSLPVVAELRASDVVPQRVLFADAMRIHVADRSRQPLPVLPLHMTIGRERGSQRDIALRELHEAREASMVRRAWARAKLREMLAGGAGDDELIAHGRAFTQLTPRTSLLVLESWHDYARYDIPMPPDVLAEEQRDEEEQRRALERHHAPPPPPVMTPGSWTMAGRVLEASGTPLPGVTVVLQDGDVVLSGSVTDVNGRFLVASATAPADPIAVANLDGFNDATRKLAGIAPGSNIEVTMSFASVSESITVTAAAAPEIETSAVMTSVGASLRTPQVTSDDLLNILADDAAMADEDPDVRAAAAQHRRKLTVQVGQRLRGISSTAERLRYYLSARSLLGGDKGFHVFAAEAFRERSPEIAARVLSDLAEARPDDAPLLRILARVLDGWGESDLARLLLSRAIEISPREPQSWREMILLEARRGNPRAVAQWVKRLRATRREGWNIDGLYEQMDEAIARWEQSSPLQRERGVDIRIDDRDDLTIELMYDTGWSWVDLHIVEPSGETVTWNHTESEAGARFTGGYTYGFGPEIYTIRTAPRGPYRVEIDYYATDETELSTESLAHIVVYKRSRRGVERSEHFIVLSTNEEHRLLTTVMLE